VVSHRLRDISLGGAFVSSDESLPLGTRCSLSIDLVGPASLLRIRMEGEVVRSDRAGIAITFTRMDLDSLVHLRHLIRIQSQRPQDIDEEFVTKLLQYGSEEENTNPPAENSSS
jgi:hypothetical protein